MESDNVFMIPFRSVRIGTLRTFPPKDMRNCLLYLSKESLSFKAALQKKELQKNSTRFVIPSIGIGLIESHLTAGCPVIWITYDALASEEIRGMACMQNTTEPSPYFDPNSTELAERRLCIIPADDPIEQNQIKIFHGVLKSIAIEKNIEVHVIHKELTRSDCNKQLIQCTQYISQLAKFRKSFRSKEHVKTDTRSAVIVTKPDLENLNENKHDFIVISSDEENSNSSSKNLNQSDEGSEQKLNSECKNILNHAREASTAHKPHSYLYDSPTKGEYIITKRKASPDLLDFDNDEACSQSNRMKHQKVEAWN